MNAFNENVLNGMLAYDLRFSVYRKTTYRAYFPTRMVGEDYGEIKEMLTEWAQDVIVGMDAMACANGINQALYGRTPKFVLWMGDYVGENDESIWEMAIASSPDGIQASGPESDLGDDEWTLLQTAKRKYFIEPEVAGVISMYLAMPEYCRGTENVTEVFLRALLSMAMSLYCEVAAKYKPGIFYGDGLQFGKPSRCRGVEIIFKDENR